MRPIVAALALAVACLAPSVAATRGGYSYQMAASSSHSHSNKAAPWVHRDSRGKIARDPRQLNTFKKQHPCPATGRTYGSCPGYVVDHVTPLKRGGADAPYNMQWQTREAAKQKDKWE
jgi:5-methylcytosine-specific restriction endonuclease McrA